MRGSSACENPAQAVTKTEAGLVELVGGDGSGISEVSGGRTQISRVLELEKGSLDASPEPYGACKEMQFD